MAAPQYTVTVNGELSWVLLFNYDNSNNNGTIREKVTVETSETIAYTTYEKEFNSTVRTDLQKAQVKTELGAAYEGISAKVDASIDVSTEVTDTLEHTTESTFKSSYSKNTSYERDSEYTSSLPYLLFVCTPSKA